MKNRLIIIAGTVATVGTTALIVAGQAASHAISALGNFYYHG